MNIALLTRNYPPDSHWGGDAVLYHNLARGLARRGHEIHVVCQALRGPKVRVEDGVFVHRVGTNPTRFSTAARVNYNLHAWLRLRRLVDARRIQVVDTPDWAAEGFLYSLQKRTPLVITALGSTDDPMKVGSRRGLAQFASLALLSLVRDIALRRADRVVAISEQCQHAVLARYPVNKQRVVKVVPGIDTDKFRYTPSTIKHERLGLPESSQVVLFVGRLEARNGVHFLCEAIPQVTAQVPDARFVFVGHDTNTAPGGGSFKQYIDDRTGRIVQIFDFLSDDDLVRLYSASDVCVYPALTSTFGLPVTEAMACGKPVVATSVGVVPELLPNASDGLKVVSDKDPRALAEAIMSYLIAHPKDKGRIAIHNRSLIESNYSIEAWADRMSHVYAQLLA